MRIWIQLQKWFHPIVYAYAVISSQGNLSTLLRNGTSEGVDFMRWGRKDGRTGEMGALLCRHEGQVVYLPTCLPISFLLRETYLPTTMGSNPFESSIKISMQIDQYFRSHKKEFRKSAHYYIVGYFVKRGVSASADKSNIVLPLLILNRLL